MITTPDISFAQLLITRFCHDITGPVGAINNGVEFIAEDNGMHGQAMSLIGDSAAQAMARVQFYRYIYGIMKEHGVVDYYEKKELAEAFYQGNRITLLWENEPLTIHHKACRILFNLLLIASSCLIRGGDVTIKEIPHDNYILLEIHASGSHLKLDEALHQALMHSTRHHPDTRTVQAYYTAHLIMEAKGTVHIDVTEEKAVIKLKLPKSDLSETD
jgi:histidine phosphotransferase ChpT